MISYRSDTSSSLVNPTLDEIVSELQRLQRDDRLNLLDVIDVIAALNAVDGYESARVYVYGGRRSSFPRSIFDETISSGLCIEVNRAEQMDVLVARNAFWKSEHWGELQIPASSGPGVSILSRAAFLGDNDD